MLTNEQIQALKSRGVPDWYIQARMTQQTPVPETPKKGFIQTLIEPAKRYGSMVGEALNYGSKMLIDPKFKESWAAVKGGYATPEQNQYFLEKGKPMFMSEQDLSKYSTPGSAALETAKNIAGMESYVIPAGRTLKTALGLGAVAGGLRGFGEAEGDMGKNIQAGLIGGAAGGGLFYGLGKLFPWIGEKFVGGGKKIETGGAVRNLGGKPSKSLGGTALFDDLDQAKIRYDNLDDLVEDASRIHSTAGKGIGEVIEKGKNVRMNTEVVTLKNAVKEKMNSLATEQAKAPYQQVLDALDNDLKPNKTGISEFFRAKHEYGVNTKPSWNATPGEKSSAEAWNFAYGKMSQLLNNKLENSGLQRLNNLNKLSSISKRALDYAYDLSSKQGTARGLSYFDFLTGAGAFAATGNPLSAAAVPALGRLITSPKAQIMQGKGMGLGGKLMNWAGEKLQNIPPTRIPQVVGANLAIGGGEQTQPGAIQEARGGQITSPGGQWVWNGSDWVKNTQASQQASTGGVMTYSQAQQMIQNDIATTGGKNMDKIIKMFEFSQKYGAGTGGTADQYGGRALNIVDYLKGLYSQVQQEGLAGGKTPLSRAGGLIGEGAAMLQTSPAAATYKSQKLAFMSIISRAAGEKGTLTDRDIDRVNKAFPKFTDTSDVASQKWIGVGMLLKQLEKSYGMQPGTLTNTDLEDFGYTEM